MAFEGVDKEVSRRQAIGLLAVAGAGVMLGCGGGTKTSTTTTTTTTPANTSCTVTPEGEEGPYFVDDSATGFSQRYSFESQRKQHPKRYSSDLEYLCV
jgi:hypothetical protein